MKRSAADTSAADPPHGTGSVPKPCNMALTSGWDRWVSTRKHVRHAWEGATTVRRGARPRSQPRAFVVGRLAVTPRKVAAGLSPGWHHVSKAEGAMTIGGDGGGVSIESPHSLQLSTARGLLLAMLRALPLTVGSRHHACPLAHRLLDLRRDLRAPVLLQLTADPSCHDHARYHLGCLCVELPLPAAHGPPDDRLDRHLRRSQLATRRRQPQLTWVVGTSPPMTCPWTSHESHSSLLLLCKPCSFCLLGLLYCPSVIPMLR